MQSDNDTWKVILSVLFFPMFFQEPLLTAVWGANDELWMMVLKRIYLLLPAAVFCLGCWATSAGLVTVLVRQKRLEFVSQLLIAWWDFARSVLDMWGGTFRFIIVFIGALVAAFRLVGFAIGALIQDIVTVPIRAVKNLGSRAVTPGVPWLAVVLTLVWCVIEASVFTYVTSPLVSDTISNLTGAGISIRFLRIPLFLFLFFIVLGSYAVLRSWTDALNERNIPSLIKIGIIELMVIFVEVMFLYREFVDALIPWFAQYAQKGFEPGVVIILSISVFAWIGIRGISWFLFASHGAPVLMAIIQGTGLKGAGGGGSRGEAVVFNFGNLSTIRKEMDWIRVKADEVIAAFALPFLQVLASAINFCTLVLVSKPLFELPLKSLKELTDSKQLLKNLTRDDK